MGSELITSQNGGQKQDSHDADGGTMEKQNLSTTEPRKGRLRVGGKALDGSGKKGSRKKVPRAWGAA